MLQHLIEIQVDRAVILYLHRVCQTQARIIFRQLLRGLRELLGRGTLLSGLELVLGEPARDWVIHLVPASAHYQFLLALLPPGAFLGLALLVAAKQWWEARPQTQPAATVAAPLAGEQP